MQRHIVLRVAILLALAFTAAPVSAAADDGPVPAKTSPQAPSFTSLNLPAETLMADSGVQARASSQEERRRMGMVKIMSGLGLAAVGAIMAANSGASATIEDPYFRGTTKISVRSNGRLYGGLGLIGAGSVLVYLGAKDRSAAAPSPSLVFEVGPRTRIVFQKRW